MSHLDLLLPFSLPPPEFASDLLKELDTPALAQLLSRTKPDNRAPRSETFDNFARALPHERWLAQTFGFDTPLHGDSSPPIAAALMQACGVPQEAGHWFVLHPVHLHVARDHLVLTDLRALALAEDEARTLFDIARAIFAEADQTLIWGNAGTWFLRADAWSALQTATPDAATGRNIDIWMPHGPHERDWRKVQNEVQMHWFGHDVNARREGAGLRPVNSLWLWGGADAPAVPEGPPYGQAVNLHGWLQGLQTRVPAASDAAAAGDLILGKTDSALVVVEDLLAPALGNDWGAWLGAMQALERDWFAPLLDALKAGRIDTLRLMLTDHIRLARHSATRASLRKFWLKPTLSPLFT